VDLLLLGPVEARLDGRLIALGAPKQRAVLAMLALHLGRTVSTDRLAGGLWGEHPPPSAPKMVQLYVSHLRRLLEGNGAEIVTRGRGYELRLSDGHVDALRFEHLLDDSRAREALALWRGEALADIADEPFAAPEIRRLEELRLRAVEMAIDEDLESGRHDEVIGELEALIDEHPLCERLHAQHMLALYRSGRQAEALEAYRDARAVLVEQIGVEPGGELRRLQDAVLAQDPALDLPLAPPTQATGARPPPARPPPRRRAAPLLAAAAVLLLAGVAAFAISRLTQSDSLPGIGENEVGRIDPDGNRITESDGVGRGPGAVVAGGGSIWVANARAGTVTRIDRERKFTTIPVGGEPAGLAFAAGSLWVANREDRTVSQIDPGADKVVHSIGVGNLPGALAAAAGALWVVSEVDRTVERIDLARGVVSGRTELGAPPAAIAAGAGALWVTSEEAGTVFRIDPRSGKVVETIDVGNGPVGVAVGEGAVWIANRQDATVSRIDPVTNAVTDLLRAGHDPSAIAFTAHAVWVANSGDATVSRIDPITRRRTTIEVESSPSALAVDEGSVWATALASPRRHRGGTLRVEMDAFHPNPFEPGGFFTDTNQLLSLAYDGLVAYRRAGGATFGTLVGDLATDVPEPSPDGHSYVFTLRRDVRYSDGTAVEPGDFRTSLEDVLRRFPLARPFYRSVVGAPACRKGHCDLSKGIETDARARTITIHLARPDADFLDALAMPFAYVAPKDHPFGPTVSPPGTGPYRVASYDPLRGVRLVRNRRFHVWSQDARPDGFADEIAVRFDGAKAQVAAVERGAADVDVVSGAFGEGLSAARVRALATRHPGQVHTNAAAELDYMFLNVHTAPFNDVRVRRAINYATDRRTTAELAGAPELAQSTCQILPPGHAGYTPSCRYTLSPNTAGTWIAPDLETAHRLIEQSGTRGMKVTVWTFKAKRKIGRYFAKLLERLGYRSALRVAPDFYAHLAVVRDPRTRAQMGIQGYAADHAAASTMMAPFACRSVPSAEPEPVPNQNDSEFCDSEIEARIKKARAARDPRAKQLWQGVYSRLAEAAPAVPFVNHRNVALVSRRVGNYQYHPLWGTLLDQLWVR
jgi:peptide/nickel transport system substrate-binding protein